MVPISASVRPDGMHSDLGDPSTYATSPRPPTRSDEQLAGSAAPVLIVQGDLDFTTNGHAALMQQLIPGSHLAILSNTTHMQATRRAELLLPMLEDFLD